MITKPVVLIGPMGVGKTTIGKKLAKRLGLPFVDTDQLIVAEHGPIQEIFANQGEATFRIYEEESLANALSKISVVATGGGAVLSLKNRDLLKNSTVIYLSTTGLHMKSRLEKGSRPLLKNGMDDWNRIYDERKPIYRNVCDFEINTSSAGLAKTIDLICEKLEQL